MRYIVPSSQSDSLSLARFLSQVFHLDIDAPDAAHLIFKLHIGETFVGSAAIPVPCLRMGFRQVPFSLNGRQLEHTALTIRSALTKQKDVESRVYYDSPELDGYDQSTFRDEFKFR
jgi:hypothetical protein